MKQSDEGFALSYNAQISADAAHGLIVGVAVTDAANDTAQLLPAVDRLEQRLNKRPNRWWPIAATPRERISRRWPGERSIFWEPCDRKIRRAARTCRTGFRRAHFSISRRRTTVVARREKSC